MGERLYFQISSIFRPEKLTIDEYNNETTQKHFFVVGYGTIFRYVGEDFIVSETSTKSNMKIKTSIMMNIIPYIVYETDSWAVEKTKYGTTYEIKSIITHHLLQLNLYLAEHKSFVHDFVVKEWNRFNRTKKISEYKESELIALSSYTNYFKFLEFEKYKAILTLWNLKFGHGSDISELLDAGRMVKNDVYSFMKKNHNKYHDGAINLENLIQLFKLNPFNWTFSEQLKFILANISICVMNKELKRQKMYMFLEELKKKVASELLTFSFEFSELTYIDEKVDNYFEEDYKDIFRVENDKIYLNYIWRLQVGICNSFKIIQRNLRDADEIERVSVKEDERGRFLNDVLWNDKYPFHILHGRGGTGKTTTIMDFLKIVLLTEETNVLVTSLMGFTRTMLNRKIIEFNNEKYSSCVKVLTMHKFIRINQVSGEKDNRPKELKDYVKNLKYVIIDEIGIIDLKLLHDFLNTIKNVVIKVIFVGDYDQFLSVESGNVMSDLLMALPLIDENTVTKLTINHRHESNSILHNVNLIYERSKNISEKFILDDHTKIQNYDGIDKEDSIVTLLDLIGQIYNTEVGHIQLCTYKNSDRKLISTKVKQKYSSYFKAPVEPTFKLPEFKHFNYFKPGERIMILHNYSDITGDIWVVNDDYYDKIKNVYTNLESLFMREKNIVGNSTFKPMTSCLCDNGQMETIEAVRLGFKRNPGGAIVGYYVIYDLWESRSTIIVGSGFVDEMYIADGVCTTIHKMQGQEVEVCVPIITPNSHFMAYDAILVAMSRATDKIIILQPSTQNKFSIIQDIVNRNREVRQSSLGEMLVQIFKNTKRKLD